MDVIEKGEIDFIINTPSSGKVQTITDGYLMMRKAVEYGIPMLTNLKLDGILSDALTDETIPDYSLDVKE
ncbi:MAG: hypothetical protein JSV27_03140 [Candidatus Bathyarchaeota archaeon]|nr:MAG: hypothetical protein JSV27_03140 [Candidatus Bathyarchaeota archaeon]